jgi:hypothetical protein
MKQIIVFFFTLCAVLEYTYAQTDAGTVKSAGTFEQTDKGSHLAGGTISVSGTNSNSTNSFNANLNPNYGYFVANNLAIGGILSLSYSYTKAFQTNLGTLSPFVRYYFGAPKTAMFFAYGSAGGGISVNDNQKGVGLFNYSVGPGFDYFVNKHVAFEALATFGGRKDYQSTTGFNNSLNLLIGLQVFF